MNKTKKALSGQRTLQMLLLRQESKQQRVILSLLLCLFLFCQVLSIAWNLSLLPTSLHIISINLLDLHFGASKNYFVRFFLLVAVPTAAMIKFIWISNWNSNFFRKMNFAKSLKLQILSSRTKDTTLLTQWTLMQSQVARCQQGCLSVGVFIIYNLTLRESNFLFCYSSCLTCTCGSLVKQRVQGMFLFILTGRMHASVVIFVS